MPTRNINLTDRLDKFIETEVTSGRYSNASEVVREGLRLMEQRKKEDAARTKWLKAAVKVALDQLERGEGVEYNSVDDFIAELDQVNASTEAARQNRRKRIA